MALEALFYFFSLLLVLFPFLRFWRRVNGVTALTFFNYPSWLYFGAGSDLIRWYFYSSMVFFLLFSLSLNFLPYSSRLGGCVFRSYFSASFSYWHESTFFPLCFWSNHPLFWDTWALYCEQKSCRPRHYTLHIPCVEGFWYPVSCALRLLFSCYLPFAIRSTATGQCLCIMSPLRQGFLWIYFAISSTSIYVSIIPSSI